MKIYLLSCVYFITAFCSVALSQESSVKVGIATILSGDFAVVGDNIQKTVKIYQELYPDKKIDFIFEDARLDSTSGLRAYEKLINSDKVDVAIAACTSNGTIAATSLFNSSKTPVISVSTGGMNIDKAGEFLFRIGNSDSLNGIEQAEYFISHGINKVALLTEQTEYTQDISRFFVPRFLELGGRIVFNEEFSPGTQDFKTLLLKIQQHQPQAIFIPTQTGTALGIILKQWHQFNNDSHVEIHTTFVAGSNPDAHQIADKLIIGVYYMEPTFSETNEELKRFFAKYRETFKMEPALPFHTAGLVDSLNLISIYMKNHLNFQQESFRNFLLAVKNYDGMLGKLSFDKDGNTAIGFRMRRIEKNIKSNAN